MNDCPMVEVFIILEPEEKVRNYLKCNENELKEA